jgi:hypothetical protein
MVPITKVHNVQDQVQIGACGESPVKERWSLHDRKRGPRWKPQCDRTQSPVQYITVVSCHEYGCMGVPEFSVLD